MLSAIQSQITMGSRMTNCTFTAAAAANASYTTSCYPHAVQFDLKNKPCSLPLTMNPYNRPCRIQLRSVRRRSSPLPPDHHPLSVKESADEFDKLPMYDRGTVAVLEVLLKDNYEVFWNELKKLREDFSSSDHFSSTANMLWEILQLLVRHDKLWIHRDNRLVVDPWAKVPLLRSCQWAEYDIDDVRQRGKWLRWLMSGRTSNTVFVSVLACVDKEVSIQDYVAYLKKRRNDVLADVVARLCKNDKQCLSSLIRMQLQPGLLLYASNKADFGRSPSPIVFSAGPSDIEQQYLKNL